jgi:hypothetical protein
MRFGLFLRAAVASCAVCFGTAALAADHFLTIGGGAGPGNTQVSLEKNVLYFQRVLGTLEAGAAHDIFFGDGQEHGNIVQFDDFKSPLPRANELLSDLSGFNTGLETRYRPHQIKSVAGPATRKELTAWFDKVAAHLPDHDRLFIYFTGHGGGGNPVRNTNFSLWGEPSMTVKEFLPLLEKVPAKVKVVLIMVQCHSGGFADLIFKNASNTAGLSDARRCGFFATWPERLAAGCTADIAEEDYHEYSTYFFAALYGKSRTGQAVPRPDYDGDGRTSLAEAHAYVQLTSDTIDIPIATSDVFLRQYSRTRSLSAKPSSKPATQPNLVSADADVTQLIKHATPAQHAVIDALAMQLGLHGPSLSKLAREAADKFDKDRRAMNNARGQLMGSRNRLRNELRGRVLLKWPELSNPWDPRAVDLLKSEGEKIAKIIESAPGFSRFEELAKQIDEKDDKALNNERQWAKCERLLYILESVALAANLESVAPKDVCQRYRELLEEENASLP